MYKATDKNKINLSERDYLRSNYPLCRFQTHFLSSNFDKCCCFTTQRVCSLNDLTNQTSVNKFLMKLFQTCLTVLMLSGFGLQAQDYSGVIQRYMLENRDKLQLVQTDIENWNVSDQYLTRHNQVTHVYLQQTVNGLKIHNAISSVAIQNNEVKSFSSAFHANAAELTNVSAGEEHISPKEAVLQAANSVGITIGNPGNRNTEPNDNNEFILILQEMYQRL